LKKAPQKLLGIGAAPWRLCREGVSDLTEGEYGVGTLGFGRGVTAGVWRYKRLRFALFGL